MSIHRSLRSRLTFTLVTGNPNSENSSTILPCSCANAGQDALHGRGKRVHNRCGSTLKAISKATPKATKWRCTVCLAER